MALRRITHVLRTASYAFTFGPGLDDFERSPGSVAERRTMPVVE